MHIPVMLDECLEALAVDPDGIYVDGTLGNGGHAEAIAAQLGPKGMLIGFDRDEEALQRVKERLINQTGKRVELIHDNYANMSDHLDRLRVASIQGLLLDLGVSSGQLDTAERGFSFRFDAPLDMRMDRSQGMTAADLVNSASEQELADIIYKYGEERAARRIARRIVEARAKGRIQTTLQLAELVERAGAGRGSRRIHPATKTFQAIRIAVNDELAAVEEVLSSMVQRMADGGRMAVLTFHSLEDRLVKQFFNRHVPREESLQQGGVRRVYEEPAVQWVWKKPLKAGRDEQRNNPRSRSARLRAVRIGV